MSFHSRSILFEILERSTRKLGAAVKNVGKMLYKSGLAIQGPLLQTEALHPNPNFIASHSLKPSFPSNSFVAPNTSLIGNVKIAEEVGVFYNCIVSGVAGGEVHVARGTIIQDLAIIKGCGAKTQISESVLIGPNTLIENSSIGKGAIIGAGATLVDCEVGVGAVVAPGTSLKGVVVPAGEVWAGSPGKLLRKANEEEQEYAFDLVSELSKIKDILLKEESKSGEEQMVDQDLRDHMYFYVEEGHEEIQELIPTHDKFVKEGYPMYEEDEDEGDFRMQFIEWNKFIKRYPEKRLPNMDDSNVAFPPHLAYNNVNFKNQKDILQSLENQKKTPDTSTYKNVPYSDVEEQNNKF